MSNLELRNVFISYGRADSKTFASKLCNALKDKGLKVWFDQNDIPLGVDFQTQIDDGIKTSDNFVFIIAPHSLKSIYCLREVELAVKLNKRIIPILHVSPDSQEIWDKMHPTIGKLNWIYFQEQINDFDSSFNGLLELINKHSDYVQKHTELLIKALTWEANLRQTDNLLISKERIEANEWIATKFDKEQAPCLPTDLHCEFICESEKEANHGMTEAFIAYSENDLEIQSKIVHAITQKGITTWLDTRDIKKGARLSDAIYQGIEQADNFLFFTSQNSISDQTCLTELDYAVELNKRIIPILIGNVNKQDLPKNLQSLQFIDFTDNKEFDVSAKRLLGKSDFDKDIDDILNEINKEKNYYRTHKVILNQAIKWEKQKRNPSILLRGHYLQNTQAWLKTGQKRLFYKPTELQEIFIAESQLQTSQIIPEIFISYSRSDSDFARKLNNELQIHGKTTWFDQESIESGANFQQEIHSGIEISANFVFIISPESVDSPYCIDEVNYANTLQKRMIPVLYRRTSEEKIPQALSKFQWIDFELGHGDFHTSFSELVRSLDTDRDHVNQHSKWTQKALEWKKNNQASDFLLRGSEFAVADTWLNESWANKKLPSPTVLQKEYIETSEKSILAASIAEKERQAYLLRLEKKKARITQIFAILMAFALVFSIYLAYKAYENAEIADRNAKIAEKKSQEAVEQKEKAERAQDEAIMQKEKAILSGKEAIKQRELAELATKSAINEREKAQAAEVDAKKQKNDALESKKIAEIKKTEAENAKVEAFKQKDEADIAKTKALFEQRKSDKLFMLSQSKNLANQAIQFLNENQIDLSINLALHAFFINQEYGGKGRTAENYQALYQVLNHIRKTGDNSLNAHTFGIRSIAYDPKENIFASGGEDKKIKVWQEKDSLKQTLIAYIDVSERIRTLAISPEGQYLLAGLVNGEVWRYDLKNLIKNPKNANKTKTLIAKFKGVVNQLVYATSLDKKNYYLAMANSDSVSLLKSPFFGDQFSKAGTFKNQGKINAIALNINKEGSFLLAGGNDKKIHVLEIQENEKQLKERNIWNVERPITALALSSDGKYFAFGANNGYIAYGITKDLSTSFTALLGHNSAITDLVFTADHNQLASSSLDNTVRLWRFNEKEQDNNLVLKGHSKWVWNVAFNQNQSFLLSAGEDGTIYFYPTTSEQIAEELCNYLNKTKKMSKQELQKYLGTEMKYRNKNCMDWE
ncbi:MAG: TIR domain-containing protein [Bacteroidetes bacterium]|nr:MAG: TIR domain-containing protein [Bacteroidota bacterium]